MGDRRLFAAVLPPADQLMELEDFLDTAGISSSGIRVVRPDKWHITLSFMPTVQFPQAETLHDALTALASRTPPLDLVVRGAGLFALSRSSPIWMGVQGDLAALSLLASGCRAAGHRSGTRVDSSKDFRPHLTVSRRPPPDHGALWIQRLAQFRGTPWTVTEFALLESTLGHGTPARYHVVERHALTG